MCSVIGWSPSVYANYENSRFCLIGALLLEYANEEPGGYYNGAVEEPSSQVYSAPAMALVSGFSRPRSGSLSAGSVRLFAGSSPAGSVRAGGNSSGSDSWFSLSRLHGALPAARASVDAAPILLGPGRQQEAMQGLNERLAGYLQRVQRLHEDNRALEEEIAAVRARRAGAVCHKDWEANERPLAELRKQVRDTAT